ncbi:mitotic-spindle organizing gamma-tubulin ring associated-domain-containing protein [Circinella umbellata]|nr:mitotic-spindle organizing gamma-tubulin ring associated-domain-containing protein [Circinella umbellata]
MDGSRSTNVKETLDSKYYSLFLLDMATMLDTGLDRDALALCVSMCERGVNPEALAEVIKELRKQKEAKAL